MGRAKRQKEWPPTDGPVRDERLAFLAAEADLRRIARRRGTVLGLLANNLGLYGRRARWRMLPLGLACEEAAKKFDALERRRLRERGELPDWFIPEIERIAPGYQVPNRSTWF